MASLKEIREARGLSKKQVVDALDTSYATIGNWERGYTEPKLSDIVALCNLYHVSADVLCGVKELKPRTRKSS